jgi:hypothetical protein
MTNDTYRYGFTERSLKSISFAIGAVVLLGWFFWQGRAASDYALEEWLVFYIIALLSWQPLAAWLAAESRWMPAAELFFLLHIPYYVSPFVGGNEKFVQLEPGTRMKVGLIIMLFLLACRICYRVPRGLGKTSLGQAGLILDRMITSEWRNQLSWYGLIAWCLFTICIQQGWLPDFGTYLNLVRSLIWSAGTIGMFILYNEMGSGRLGQTSKAWLIAITALTVFFQVATGFLIGSAMQMSMVFLAIFLGTKKLPLVTMLASAAVFAFLHVGKADMRDEFWDQRSNYSTVVHDPLDIFQFWIGASWNRLVAASSMTDAENNDAEVPNILERGNLLGFLSRIVSDTPELLPYMGGTTYAQTALIFVPRFLWPEKPRASTPNETLAIYYGVLTLDSAEYVGVGMGRIGEAWANFGWAGICVVGAIMGLFLRIPAELSAGYSPLHVRFLLSVPFILFAMALEECLGPAIHALSSGLALSFAFLWVASIPTSAPVPDKIADPPWLGEPKQGANT